MDIRKIDKLKKLFRNGEAQTFTELKRNCKLHRSILNTQKELWLETELDEGNRTVKEYRNWLINVCEDKDINPTHFVTLLFLKNQSPNDCISGYYQFLKILKRKAYGRYSEDRNLKEITVLEKKKNGEYHIHCLLQCEIDKSNLDIFERWRIEIKKIWTNKIRGASRVGISNKQDFFVPIYNKKDLLGYITKYFKNDQCGELISVGM